MIYAIPSITSYYFTRDKHYPCRVIADGRLYEVVCDKGHRRVISSEPGRRCPHLLYAGEIVDNMDTWSESNFRWKCAGSFVFVKDNSERADNA